MQVIQTHILHYNPFIRRLNLRFDSGLALAGAHPSDSNRRRSPLAHIDQNSVRTLGIQTGGVSQECRYLWGYLSELSTESHRRVG